MPKCIPYNYMDPLRKCVQSWAPGRRCACKERRWRRRLAIRARTICSKNLRKQRVLGVRSGVLCSSYPKGSTAQLGTLVPKTIPGTVYGTRTLKWVDIPHGSFHHGPEYRPQIVGPYITRTATTRAPNL